MNFKACLTYTRSQETSAKSGIANVSKGRAEITFSLRNRMHHGSRDFEEEGNMTSCTVKFASVGEEFCLSF